MLCEIGRDRNIFFFVSTSRFNVYLRVPLACWNGEGREREAEEAEKAYFHFALS